MATKRDPDLVARDQLILDRLGRIDHKLDSIEQTTAFALRANEDQHRESVRAIFRRGVRRAQVYLAADGSRTVQEIASFLEMVRPAVSRELAKLAAEGLLEVTDSTATGDVYSKKPVDRSLRISRFLCEEYGLGADGLPVSKAKRSRRGKARRGE